MRKEEEDKQICGNDKWVTRNASQFAGEKMNFLLNKRTSDVDNNVVITTTNVVKPLKSHHKKHRHPSTDSSDSTIPSAQWGVLALLEDSGIASTSNDAHSLEFDDHPPATPPPTIVIHSEKAKVQNKNPCKPLERHGFLEKGKASSSVPSMSINSNATVHIHYYPEESISWSYVIVTIALIVQLIMHGLQLSFGVFLLIILNNFRKDHIYLIEIG